MESIKKRDLLTLLDYSEEEINYLLDLAQKFKDEKQKSIPHKELVGKNIALIFEKTSTRTRCSFEVASFDLGMNVTYLDSSSSQLGHKESIADTARVLSRLYDGIEYRGFSQKSVEKLAKYSSVPVWNGLTDEFHPTQALADALTIREHFKNLKGLKVSFFGDCRNNVANSLMIICSKLGINYTACGPKELWPSDDLVATCVSIAKENGGKITLTNSVIEGATDADVIYTDVFVSMGEKDDIWEKRISQLLPYQVNKKVMTLAKPTAVFMHDLPSFHNLDTTMGRKIYEKFGLKEMEVTDEVFESNQSIVFMEAENRMHTIKAVMYATLRD